MEAAKLEYSFETDPLVEVLTSSDTDLGLSTKSDQIPLLKLMTWKNGNLDELGNWDPCGASTKRIEAIPVIMMGKRAAIKRSDPNSLSKPSCQTPSQQESFSSKLARNLSEILKEPLHKRAEITP